MMPTLLNRRMAALAITAWALASSGSHAQTQTSREAVAIVAGGCFWCVEADFDKVDGVLSTTSGYIGGMVQNPTYKQVSDGKTGHTEAVRIVYDPSKVSYERLLDVFWRNHDPLVKNRQFCDSGPQYRAGIFYLNDEQKRLAEASKQKLDQAKRFPGPIVTEITKATQFFDAEDYHQDYYTKNPIRYKYYRFNCGRDARLKELWGNGE